MHRKLLRLLDYRKVTIENPVIAHETSTAVLVEFGYRHAWLPKTKIQIERNDEACSIVLPKWLYERKF